MSILRRMAAHLDAHIEYALMTFFYSYFIFIVILEIILRYGFGASTGFSEETARHSFIWLAWIAASLAVKHRVHISITAVYDRVPLKVQYVLTLFYNVLFLLLCLFGIRYVIPIIDSQFTYGTLSQAARYPMFIVFLVVPLGYGMMCLRILQNVILDVRDMRAGSPIRRGLAMF